MVAPRGSVATVEIYGLKIGFIHGHHGFRYLDGVGGLYIPARKYIMRKFSKANYYLICMGHHHQYLQDTMFLCNGSMIGYDQYADSCGFPFDIPKQTFFLIEEKRQCRTVTRPILFDD
jgi:predicted phosphodiesterase